SGLELGLFPSVPRFLTSVRKFTSLSNDDKSTAPVSSAADIGQLATLRRASELAFRAVQSNQKSSPPGGNCGRMAYIGSVGWGGVMSFRKACLILLLISSTAVLAQVSHPEQVQITPPLLRGIDPPAPDATPA